jgi:hypothetical protein
VVREICSASGDIELIEQRFPHRRQTSDSEWRQAIRRTASAIAPTALLTAQSGLPFEKCFTHDDSFRPNRACSPVVCVQNCRRGLPSPPSGRTASNSRSCSLHPENLSGSRPAGAAR